MRIRRSLFFLLGTGSLGLLASICMAERPSTRHSRPSIDVHLQLALDLDLHRGDPALDRLLARDLRFAGLTGTDADLAEEARRLGLAQRSPTARKRLLKRLEDIVLDGIPEPGEATLQAHLQRHPELLPTRVEVRLETPSGASGWLGPADLARRPDPAPVVDRRTVAPDLQEPSHRAVVQAHWRSAELRRRWTALGQP